MIRVEGIPEVARRLRKEPGLRIATPDVRGTSRIVAIGKALIAVITHYRRRQRPLNSREDRPDLGHRMDVPCEARTTG